MDWKSEARAPLSWADSYEDYEELLDDEDETVQHLNATHDLWRDLLKSWAEAGGSPMPAPRKPGETV